MTKETNATVFVTFPSGNAASIGVIGSVKLYDTGVMVHGHGPDDMVEWIECKGEIARRVRDTLVAALTGHRPGRPFPTIDWQALMTTAPSAAGAAVTNLANNQKRAN